MIEKSKFIFLICLASLLSLWGCQDYNSNSSDKFKYTDSFVVGEDPLDPNFAQAMQIIRAKCVNCHKGYHNSWVTYDNATWVSRQLVVPGNPDGSPLILSTTNAGGFMPEPPGANLTTEEYNFLRKWVTELP